MSKVDPYLQFPSGRTIKDVKNDAKRFARTADISHTSALDTLARVNGLDMGWSAAMCELARDQCQERPSDFDLHRPPRIYHVGLESVPSADLDHSEPVQIADARVRLRHRMRRQRLRHALQLHREGHLAKVAIAEVCGISITELQVHICRMTCLENAGLLHQHRGLATVVRRRRSTYQREHESE